MFKNSFPWDGGEEGEGAIIFGQVSGGGGCPI